MSYCGASRLLEKKIFSPTQSLKRLTSSSSGRTALPPSHPHAATSDAVPAPAANRSSARRSIMAGEPPAIPSGDDRQHAHENDERVRELLQRVVFALRRMLLAEAQVILLHLDRTADVARPKQERAPLAARHEIREIEQASGDERPHQCEMPIQCAGKPAAEPAPLRESVVLKRIGAVVGSAALTKARIGRVDLQPARDHPDQ